MTDKLNEIQNAIDNFQMDEARRLLRKELAENPSADGYYLASQAAKTHGQRVQYLEQALELDPFHQAAHDELANIMPPDMVDAPVTSSTPRKSKSKNEPTYRYASIGKRFVALVIDSLILGLIGGVVGGVYGTMFAPTMPPGGQVDATYLDAIDQLQTSAMMLGVIINAIYYVVTMKHTNGQTPGKRVMGIRAVKKDGTPFTYMDAVVRNVIGYWLSGIFLLGYAWAMIDSERQGWHDKIAGTVVVEDK